MLPPEQVVRQFWTLMQGNDFHKVGEVLSEDFECIWPQSSEKIVGANNFAEINSYYPAHGQWEFTINRLVCDGADVVTEVDVTDGKLEAKVISFHTVADGLIVKQVEYWPDSYEAPAWRKKWVVPLN